MTMLSPDTAPPILSEPDLTAHWRMLMEPLGFGRRRLYLGFIDADGRMLPQLVEIDQVPAGTEPRLCGALLQMCRGVLDDGPGGASVAVLYARPGTQPVTGRDRSWASSLHTAAEAKGVRLWPTHLACDDLLTVL